MSFHLLLSLHQRPAPPEQNGFTMFQSVDDCTDGSARRLKPHMMAEPTSSCPRFGHGFWRSVLSVLSAVVLDFLLIGFGIATLGWCGACCFRSRFLSLTTSTLPQ